MKTILPIMILAWMAMGCTNCDSTAHASPAVWGEIVLVQFTGDANLNGWKMVDGGTGCGFAVNEAGNAVFSGSHGEAAIQCDFDPVNVAPCRSIDLGLKGDGRWYQLILQTDRNASQVYNFEFQTRGEWETIEIPFADMTPAFSGQTLARIQILSDDDAPGPFRLEIDRIWLK